MKDLYKRLHVQPTASEADIRAALSSTNTDTDSRAAAEFILLNPTRRKVYDRHHRLLTTIAQLRSRLTLGLRPFWSHGHHQDFNVPFTPRRTPANLDPIQVVEATEHHRHRSRSVVAIIAGIIVAASVACWWWMTHR